MATCGVLAPADLTKLAGGNACFEVGANLWIGHLAHAASHRVYEDGSFIKYRFTLETLVAGKGQSWASLLGSLFKGGLMGFTFTPRLRLRDDPLCLISVFGGNLTMRGNDLGRRQDLFSIACVVCRNLSGFRAWIAAACDGLHDLLPTRAGRIKILLRIAFDVGRAAPPWLDLIPQRTELIGQVGLVDGCCELLGLEQTARLQSAHGSILALCHIEDHRMGVKLRRGISVDRASGVMLKSGGNESPGGFGGMVAADAGLRIVLQLVKSEGNGPTMCLANLVIAAHESRQRNGFRRREGSVPTGTMLDGCNGPPVVRLVFMGDTMLHKLFAGRRMLTFGQAGKLQGSHPAREAKLLG
jgi:hypothetical protein